MTEDWRSFEELDRIVNQAVEAKGKAGIADCPGDRHCQSAIERLDQVIEQAEKAQEALE